MKELQDMLNIMRDRSEDKISYIARMVKSDEVECFKYIPKLDSQFLYDVFQQDVKNSLDNCYGLLCSLHHAFIDDGDYWVAAKVNKIEFMGEANYYYNYYVTGGDNWDCRSVTDEQLCGLFEKQMELQDYQEENKHILQNQEYQNCLLDVKYAEAGYGSGKDYPDYVLAVYEVEKYFREEVDKYLEGMYNAQWYEKVPKPEEYFEVEVL